MNNLMSIIIALASLSLARFLLWPALQKVKIKEGLTFKEFFTKTIPTVLLEIGKFVAIFGGTVGLAFILDKNVAGMVNGGFVKLGLVSVFVAIIFLTGVDPLVKHIVSGPDLKMVRGLYGLPIILLVHSQVPNLAIGANWFILVLGVYIGGLIFAWAMCYWPKMQTLAALPIGFLIAVAVITYDRFLSTGEFYFDITRPNWQMQIWPFMLFVISIAVLMVVFYKKIHWRKRWAYPVLYLLFVGFLVKSSMIIILLTTDDISGKRIVSAIEYNRATALYTESMALAIEKDGGKDHFTAQMASYQKGLESGEVNPAEALRVLSANMARLEDIEKKRAEAYKNRPEKIYLEMILWKKTKGLWQSYVTPLIKRVV